ncbi:hypothetical protein [Streptomyces sp. NPDC005078]|uniref:hypothetical protein n=1 Tax=Streptomyces sp. NPDC005078 TaxID=3154293 RepID=UPI0033B91987
MAWGPPNWTGKPRLDRLAVLGGRRAEHLERALADGSVAHWRTTVTGPYETLARGAYLLYRARRQDAEEGLASVAARRATRRQPACRPPGHLTGSLPPARQGSSPYRKTPVIASVRHLVNPVIS